MTLGLDTNGVKDPAAATATGEQDANNSSTVASDDTEPAAAAPALSETLDLELTDGAIAPSGTADSGASISNDGSAPTLMDSAYDQTAAGIETGEDDLQLGAVAIGVMAITYRGPEVTRQNRAGSKNSTSDKSGPPKAQIFLDAEIDIAVGQELDGTSAARAPPAIYQEASDFDAVSVSNVDLLSASPRPSARLNPWSYTARP